MIVRTVTSLEYLQAMLMARGIDERFLRTQRRRQHVHHVPVLRTGQILHIAPEIEPSQGVETTKDRHRNPEMPVQCRPGKQVILPVKEATVRAIGLQGMMSDNHHV